MKRFLGPILSSNVTSNGHKMSDEIIKDIINSQPVVPVTINFGGESIGYTELFSKEGQYLQCHMLLDEKKVPPHNDEEKLYVVGMYEIKKQHKEGEVTVIDDANILEAAVTILPADPTLTPLKQKKD